ncbi:MAG: glycerophosphodiester phosphodiesterase family protein [Microbacterium sp.]
MTHPYFEGVRTPAVFAHRGLVTKQMAKDGIAENSVAAIAAAEAAGADYVESDCHLTSDGVVVLFHDPTLTRVTGDPRAIADVTSTELAEIMADRGGLAVLEDVLSDFPDVRFNIDVKAEAAARKAGRLVAPHAHRVLLTSFSEKRRRLALAAAAPARPATSLGSRPIGFLVAASILGLRRWALWLLRNVDAVQVPHKQGKHFVVLRPRLLRYAHEAGVLVQVWTINHANRMEKWAAFGVDGIITDHADTAVRVLRDRST